MQRIYPRFIVVHHTAGHDVPAIVINGYHADRGYGGKITSPVYLVNEYVKRGFKKSDNGVIVSIGYHYLIRADGSVEKGRPDFVQGAHCRAGGMNFSSIGVALTGNFDSRDNPNGKKGHMRPTEEQVCSLKKLIVHLAGVYKIPQNHILKHKDVPGAATSCPGDRF